MSLSNAQAFKCSGWHSLTISKGYRLTLPASAVATAAAGLEWVATVAGGCGWLLVPADNWQNVVAPGLTEKRDLDAMRSLSSASWLTLGKTRRLTLPASLRSLALFEPPALPFPAVLFGLQTHFELWPSIIWERDRQAALRRPAALASLRLDD
jgi:DNA-binding transcriptional regulator/RsmH inhibitor MraZ